MSLATLKNQLNTGISSLDYEHRKLVDLMEELCDQFDSAQPAGRAEKNDAVSDCFGMLHARVSAHFALEENLMRRGKYPQYAVHKADHERLLESIRDMMDAYDQGRCADCGLSLRDCLEEWFAGHVQSADTALRALEQ